MGALASASACGRDGAPPSVCPPIGDPPAPSTSAAESTPTAADEYLVSDMRGTAAPSMIALSRDRVGAIVDGLRVVVGGREQRVGADAVDPPIGGVYRVPEGAGGGYVFTSPKHVYYASEFDGPLRFVAAPAGGVSRVVFAGRAALVLGPRGARAAYDVATGKPAAQAPLDVVDVAQAPDGRTAALTAHGTAFVSVDGARFRDVTRDLGAAPSRVTVSGGAVVIVDQQNGALRLEPSGAVQLFDVPPPDVKIDLRAKDPRWRGSEPPLRVAMRSGLSLDESTALVFDGGDVARVDLRTGSLRSVRPTKLPHDLTCEPLRADGSVLVACARSQVGAVVATRADQEPEIEMRFVGSGALVASDDGGLLYTGPCQPGRTGILACVRQRDGQWREVEVAPTAVDAGAPGAAGGPGKTGGELVRWIPRADGTALALVSRPPNRDVEVIDTVRARRRALGADPAQRSAVDALVGAMRRGEPFHTVWRAFNVMPSGAIRAWTDRGYVEVFDDGSVAQSLTQYELVVSSGPLAFARGKGGRAFQTTDRGTTWTEVAAPPTGRPTPTFDVRSCSPAGCDLGAFYRVGWRETSPGPAREPRPRAPVPVDDARVPELACDAAGEERTTDARSSGEDGDGFGLGALKLPPVKDPDEALHHAYGRTLPHPVHDGGGVSGDDNSTLRAVVTGFQLEDAGGGVVVRGPLKDPAAARYTFGFVAPFDPAAVIRRPTFAASEIALRARLLGVAANEAFPSADDASMASLTSADPTGADDLAVHGASGVVVLARGDGSRLRFAVAQEMRLGSGVVGADREPVLLFVDEEGRDRVRRFDGAGLVDLFELAPPPSSSEYPANVDALAISERGGLGILRTPSGESPPSELSPALVFPRGGAPIALAPWATLRSADDPACRADASGYRATVAVGGRWIRFAHAGQRHADASTTLLRVRWSTERVCLEGVELRRAGKDSGRRGRPTDPWLVARFTGAPTAAFVAVTNGAESRQRATCTLQR